MARRKKVPELMGAVEVAKELGVAPNNLNKVVGVPDPVQTNLRRGKLWIADEIRQFAAERRDKKAERASGPSKVEAGAV